MKTLLATAALIAWGLKRYYADARAGDLLWILTPTAQLVGVVTGARFTLQPEEGYFSREHLFLIEKSCAGVNFMIAAFAMLVFALRHRAGCVVTAAQVLGVSLLAGYTTAVVVNAVRIALSMWLAAHAAVLTAVSAADLHRFEGVVVYFGGLVLLYELAQRLDRRGRAFRRLVLPLASYYAVTLALPLANGAARSGTAFVHHAVIVLLAPPLVIVLVCIAYGIARAFAAGCGTCLARLRLGPTRS